MSGSGGSRGTVERSGNRIADDKIVSAKNWARFTKKLRFSGTVALLLLMVAGAGSLLAGPGSYPSPYFIYDYTWTPGGSTAPWQTNGGASFGSSSITFGSGGSIIYTATVSGGNSNDYEVESQFSPASGANYVHFLRATSTSVQAGSGTYISVELNVSTYTGSPASVAATLKVNQRANGSVTNLSSANVAVMPGNANSFRSIAWETNLWVYLDGQVVWGGQIPQTSGSPGLGAYGSTPGAFTQVAIGRHDTVDPNPISSEPVASSVFPKSVSLAWPATTDDQPGIGLHFYKVKRNGVTLGETPNTEFTDNSDALQPGTAYPYTIVAGDQHANPSLPLSFSVTTPPAGDIDPRRIGVQKNGSYWGGGGEQIDTLSGNVNFTIPTITLQMRSGQKMPLNLSYNSQNWRQDSGYNWQLGDDKGYGFGWTLQFGSLTPYYSATWEAPDHYVFTDSTGAQYSLNVNNNNVWSSSQSIYVWFDATANRLHFKDGSFWVMGCTSGGTEPDFGTMYPTILEDVNGNQIVIQYFAAASLPSADYNSSSRISQIADSTSSLYPQGFITPPSYYDNAYYAFQYNSDTPVPHLTSIFTPAGIPGNYGLTYVSSPLSPPFGSDSRYSGVTTTHLASVFGPPLLGSYSFTYDTASAGELLKVQFPYGGCLGWGYVSFTYAGGRTMREAGSRYLDADSACSTQWNYTISRPDAPNSVIVHSAMTLVDASGVGSKTWNFIAALGSPASQLGLLSSFVQQASTGGTVLQQDSFTWSLDPANNPYISQKVTAHDPNSGNPQSAQTNQTLDQYGNATQSVVYGFNNTSAPIQTYNNTYLQSGPYGTPYVSNYVLNRLVSSVLTLPDNINKTMVTNTYDVIGITATGASQLLDTTVSSSRGLLNYSETPAGGGFSSYWDTGHPYNTNSSNGASASYTGLAASNYAAPGTITTESYNAQISYNTWLGVTGTTGANSEQVSMYYDDVGRPAEGISAFGGTTNYTYSASGSTPFWQQEDGPNGITITTLDGLGRAVRVTREDGRGAVQSYQDTVYAPCACSPLGKIQKVSLPYAPGATKYWTTYTYDGLGRTLSVQKPDGVSTTTYSYSGNQTTVTDSAGLAKTFAKDVLGNLLTVVEPDPTNQPSGTVTTSYTYDWMNHVSCVDMDRGGTVRTAYTYTSNGVTCTSVYTAGTGTRQTRTFVYSDAGLLTSATNPENGTVTYTYNSTNTLNTRTDAKGQTFAYTYDFYIPTRLVEIQKYPQGQNYAEDVCARVNYTYGYDQASYNYGRLVNASTQQSGCYLQPSYNESYTYGAPGNVQSKTVTAGGATWNESYGETATINYGYDSYGRTTSVQYPFSQASLYGPYYSSATFTTTYDTMGRPSGLTDSNNNTWVNSASTVYDYAGRLQTLNFLGVTETRGYNTVGQIASIGWSNSNYGQPSGTLTYTYPSGQTGIYSDGGKASYNNGQISQTTDSISGETTVYQYDALKRVVSASNGVWNETFTYDGFGNLTGKKLNGTLQSIAVNSATNQLSGPTYDFNGNMTVGAGATMTYNEDNKMSSAQVASGSVEYYYYTPDGKRFARQMANGDTQYTLYGAYGEALGTFSGQNLYADTQMSVYFGGRRLWQGATYSSANGSQGAVFADRLGSNRYTGNYYPYGDAAGTAPQDQVGFATYTQDSYTGLDYAVNRYYSSYGGRFNTPDPYAAKAKGANDPATPASWNRYAYVEGDPVNNADPQGLLFNVCDYDCFGPGGCVTVITDGVEQPSPCDWPPGPVPVRPPQPTCSIQLFERPAFFRFSPWGHTYLYVDCSTWAAGLTIDGDPGRIPVAGQPPTQSGWLHAPWLAGFVSIVGTGPGHSSPASGIQVGPTVDVSLLEVSEITASVYGYDYGGNVQPYVLFPYGSQTYNSNSFTQTLLQDYNLLSYFVPGGSSSLPIFAPGWNNTVPGLNPFP